MKFRTRAFLLCFIPFVLLLCVSFGMIQRLVQSTVREGLRQSLRANHQAVARARSRSELQNSRFLRIAGENAALKAGLRLLLSEHIYQEKTPGVSTSRMTLARNTLEDQLMELCGEMGFDLLPVSGPDGRPLAGVGRSQGPLAGVGRAQGELQPMAVNGLAGLPSGLMVLDGRALQIASTPLDQADENLGTLSVGETFDLAEFTTPAVLLQGGKVIQSSVPGVPPEEIGAALSGCPATAECDLVLGGATYLSLPMQGSSPGDGYLLRSVQSVDAATGPVETILRNVFGSVALMAMLVALLCSVATSGSIGKPIAVVIQRLREAEGSGFLPELGERTSGIREIRDLMESFDRAAVSVREARTHLHEAYVEFVGSLAHALDARDPYTAGHSQRVSSISCAIAEEMGLDANAVQKIRIGALLHDIGKIGISDVLLRKPGRLTDAEFAVIKEHPDIGRRILEGVQGFAPYLAAVELHHENWDGSGYPHGQSGEQTPLDARIIHVADAWDAMTTDRPYRKGMSPSQANDILLEFAGIQFDERAVEAFLKCCPQPAAVEAYELVKG